ncbi:helix-turn-helix domain-containing protein [Rhizobium oryzicola]|uniref:XRE family transcriptional regulator n=1 Tax=Rhizobium oryzicola TaxID=1232668 RepID=A0ABT8SQ39_9HYPH|nr:XRE family transcriptional regulator [Rhizobium oryzicola]MDO1580615.1 XRE family transcriptional regulator [Rhizobium oryzicola]
MKDIRPIRTQDDLDWALGEIEPYFDNPPPQNSPEADRFDILSDLIEAYENRMVDMPAVDPIDVLQFYMQTTGRTQGDLAELLGSRSRASEVLRRKRALTLDMINRLRQEWHIPADSLVEPYALVA